MGMGGREMGKKGNRRGERGEGRERRAFPDWESEKVATLVTSPQYLHVCTCYLRVSSWTTEFKFSLLANLRLAASGWPTFVPLVSRYTCSQKNELFKTRSVF